MMDWKLPIAATLAFFISLCSQHVYSADIYVAPGGSDHNPGTLQKPKASLAAAIRQARELRRLHDPSVIDGIHIIVKGGTYSLRETLFIRPEDSGTEDSPTIIEAAAGELPVVSGGVQIKGWKKASAVAGLPVIAKGQVWEAEMPLAEGRPLEFRQLWINDQKAIRAKDINGDSMHRILSWNHQTESCWIPKPKAGDLSSVEGLEMFIHQWWAIANLRIKSIKVQGDSAQLTFYQPESRVQSEHPWPAPWISKQTGNSAFHLTNALQFLDSPGEWYLDQRARKVYYWPRKDENMSNARVIAPYLETLVKVQGTIDHPVSHFYFKGISFQHASWLRPSKEGHVPHQAGMYMLDAYQLKIPGTPDKKGLENQAWVGRPAAAVEVKFSDHTGFEACRFEHMASTGLDYYRGTHNDEIKGNLFQDIGGTAILVGVFSDEAVEAHLPYNPADERDVSSNTLISNNLVTNATNEDWGCVGIGAGYVKGIRIEHNEICDVSYTGISMGWGWTRTVNVMRNNSIIANHIHHYAKHMYDVAGIYTLSAQPGSLIQYNYVDSIYKAPYAHDPNHWFYLYTDEGSSYISVRDNWCPAEKFLQNANGPGNTWENNGPKVSDTIKNAAGIQARYQYLLKQKEKVNITWPVNQVAHANSINDSHGKPFILELVEKPGNKIDLSLLKTICEQNGLQPANIYQWKDHYVLYDTSSNATGLEIKLRTAFPGAAVRPYNNPFYEFNRTHCENDQVAKEWDHVILTANLVADTQLQKEYMEYHATQFQKWPEVSNGFCHANFQQLLLFRNGRQLMLVISIPKGSSLDELNPKTIENNPRVNDWNAIMKKYQEGIAGTKQGEVWVFLKPIGEKL